MALVRLKHAGVQGEVGPIMNEEKDPERLLSRSGSPKAKLANEDETPVTIGYDELIKSWE